MPQFALAELMPQSIASTGIWHPSSFSETSPWLWPVGPMGTCHTRNWQARVVAAKLAWLTGTPPPTHTAPQVCLALNMPLYPVVSLPLLYHVFYRSTIDTPDSTYRVVTADRCWLLLPVAGAVQVDATFSSISCCATGVTCYIKTGGCVM